MERSQRSYADLQDFYGRDETRRIALATCLSKRATAFGVITIGASWPVALRSAIRLM
jgi:hypothetical protein